jgi:hypothetical protein
VTLLFLGLVLYTVVLALVCASALILGGPTERRFAVVIILAMVLSQFAALASKQHWHGPEYGVAIVDAGVLVAFVVLAHRSERFWPLWASAAQLIALISHLPAILFPHLPMEMYASIQPFWAFPVFASLAIGTFGSLREANARRRPHATLHPRE